MKSDELEYLICRKIDEIVTQHGHAYVGFDIFDTLIGRIIPKEIELGYKCRRIAKHLTGDETRFTDVFAAYDRAYHSSCQKNATTGLDYEVLTPDLFRGWAAELAAECHEISEDQLYSEAIAAELSVCIALPYAKRLLERLSKKPVTLFFLSDMYLGMRAVEPLLIHHDLLKYFSFGHVSSDVGLLKRTGSLFRHVIAEKGWKPEQIVFVGDDLHADVAEPTKLGVQSFHYFIDDVEAEREELRRLFNRAEDSKDQLPTAIYRALSGFKFQHRSVEDVAVAKYLGAFFSNFAHKIDETITEVSAEHVLFAAREGLFLRKAVEALRQQTAVKRRQQNPLFHYFPSSRLTSVQFGVHNRELGLREMVGAISNGGNTLRHLLSFLSLSEDELTDIVHSAGFSGPDEVLHFPLWDWSPFQRVIDRVNTSDGLKRLREQGDRFEQFMKQQGILDGSTKLLVDLGWSGQIQDNLATGLARRGHNDRLVGLYAGTTMKAHWKVTLHSTLLWHFADSDNRSALPHPILWYPHILENLSRSPHGSCVGFESDASGYVTPTTKAQRNPQEAHDDLLISKIQLSVLKYSAAYGALTEAYGLSAASFRDTILQVMFKFLIFPDKEIARLFSGVSNVSDFGSDEVLRSTAADGIPGIDDESIEHHAGRALWPQAVTAASLGPAAALKRAITVERHRWPKVDRPFVPGMTRFNGMGFGPTNSSCHHVAAVSTELRHRYEGWVSEIWDKAISNAAAYNGMEFRLEAADLPTHYLNDADFTQIREIDRQICNQTFFDDGPLPEITDSVSQIKAQVSHKKKRFISALSALLGHENTGGGAKLEEAERLNRERLAAIKTMDSLISERDAAIASMKIMIDERWDAMQSMEQMINERDATIVSMRQLIDERMARLHDLERQISAREINSNRNAKNADGGAPAT